MFIFDRGSKSCCQKIILKYVSFVFHLKEKSRKHFVIFQYQKIEPQKKKGQPKPALSIIPPLPR